MVAYTTYCCRKCYFYLIFVRFQMWLFDSYLWTRFTSRINFSNRIIVETWNYRNSLKRINFFKRISLKRISFFFNGFLNNWYHNTSSRINTRQSFSYRDGWEHNKICFDLLKYLEMFFMRLLIYENVHVAHEHQLFQTFRWKRSHPLELSPY